MKRISENKTEKRKTSFSCENENKSNIKKDFKEKFNIKITKNILSLNENTDSENENDVYVPLTIVHNPPEFESASQANTPKIYSERNTVENFEIDNKDIKLKHIKKLRKIMDRKKRSQILIDYPILLKISNCAAKIDFINILESLSQRWKKLFKFYMTKCFLIHLHIRQVKFTKELLLQRQNIYEAIDFPDSLNFKLSLKNNLIKNFCKGFVNFVILFFEDLINEEFISPPKKKNITRNTKAVNSV